MKKCKSCKADIDSNASKCSHCGTDQRSWFIRHKIVTGIVAIIVVLMIIGVAGSKNSGTSTTSNSTGGSSGNNTPTPSVQTAKIGETVTDGNLGFTVQSVNTAQTLGDSFSQKTAQGMYYILAVKIQNNGKSTQTINASDFTVVDSQGRTYDYSTDGQTAIEMSNGTTDFFLQQIQPSLSVTGNIVFDVPASATGLKLMAQGDIFSNPVSIDLGK